MLAFNRRLMFVLMWPKFINEGHALVSACDPVSARFYQTDSVCHFDKFIALVLEQIKIWDVSLQLNNCDLNYHLNNFDWDYDWTIQFLLVLTQIQNVLPARRSLDSLLNVNGKVFNLAAKKSTWVKRNVFNVAETHIYLISGNNIQKNIVILICKL